MRSLTSSSLFMVVHNFISIHDYILLKGINLRKKMFIAARVVVLLLAFFQVMANYDWAFGNTSVWLSAAAYCETNTYMTRTFKGYSTGFVVTNVIDDKDKDVQVRF